MKKANSQSIKISEYIQQFLGNELPQYRTESENTIKSFRDTLTLYIRFLQDEKKITPSQLTSKCFEVEILKQWLNWLHNSRGCSADTCNTRLAGIRTFLGYMAKQDIEFLNLQLEASTIPRLKGLQKKVSGLSSKALKAIFAAPNTMTKTGRRDLALLMFLYSTAARIDEALSLKLKQLNLNAAKPFVRFVGKGNKLRTIYLLPETVRILQRYIEEFHGKNPGMEEVLFYSSHKGKNYALTQTAVNKALKKYALKAHEECSEVPLDLHAHQFRHARASHWLEEGLNIVQISMLLGHQNIQTTMVYLDVSLDDKAKALEKLENSEQKKLQPKWKKEKYDSLLNFCGLDR